MSLVLVLATQESPPVLKPPAFPPYTFPGKAIATLSTTEEGIISCAQRIKYQR